MHFVLDSGATVSCVNDSTILMNMRESDMNLSTAKGNMDITACGDIRGYIKLKEKHFPLLLADVCYIPTLRVNLISINDLMKCGFDVHFKNGTTLINHDNSIVGQSHQRDGLHEIKLLVENTGVSPQLLVTTRSQKIQNPEPERWHQRLGYLGGNAFKTLMKSLNKDLSLPNDFRCTACIEGKLARRSAKLTNHV